MHPTCGTPCRICLMRRKDVLAKRVAEGRTYDQHFADLTEVLDLISKGYSFIGKAKDKSKSFGCKHGDVVSMKTQHLSFLTVNRTNGLH